MSGNFRPRRLVIDWLLWIIKFIGPDSKQQRSRVILGSLGSFISPPLVPVSQSCHAGTFVPSHPARYNSSMMAKSTSISPKGRAMMDPPPKPLEERQLA